LCMIGTGEKSSTNKKRFHSCDAGEPVRKSRPGKVGDLAAGLVGEGEKGGRPLGVNPKDGHRIKRAQRRVRGGTITQRKMGRLSFRIEKKKGTIKYSANTKPRKKKTTVSMDNKGNRAVIVVPQIVRRSLQPGGEKKGVSRLGEQPGIEGSRKGDIRC